MVATLRLLECDGAKRIAVIDADQHYGNGTDDIIQKLGLGESVFHYTFGADFHTPDHAEAYLKRMYALKADLEKFRPDVIIYQAGADAHREDPLGGVLTTKELMERDLSMFLTARELGVGIAFVLAGGYQRDKDGGISKVVAIHLNTFAAAELVESGQADLPPVTPLEQSLGFFRSGDFEKAAKLLPAGSRKRSCERRTLEAVRRCVWQCW
jgi:acetoin utilization deacetylase AcuC-like enzyme